MGSFIVYITKSALCLALFYLFYKLLLSKDTFHRFNRMALLSIFLLSFLLPFAKLSLQASEGITRAFVGMDAISSQLLQAEPVRERSSLIWVLLIVLVYLAGLVWSVLRQILSYYSLFRLIRKSKKVSRVSNVDILTHNENIAPFSWMRYILLSEKDYEENAEAILCHELSHIRNKHSWDLVLADFCIVFQWFNPASWLFRQELQSIHEYEADESVINQGIDAKQYQLLIIKKAVGTRLYSMANSFNHSSLKKRITMMLKEKSKPRARLKYIYVLPLAGLAMFAFAHPDVSKLEELSTEKVNELLAFAQADKQPSAELSADKINYILGYNLPEEVKNNEMPPPAPPVIAEEKVFMVVEDMPKFPGGDKALVEFVNKTIKYPQKALKKGIEGRVVCTYVIDTKGKVTNIQVIRSVDPDLDQEAVRVIESMPDWTPGKQQGKIVAVKYTLPITFKLGKDVPSKPEEEVFLFVEEMPKFSGGENALMEYVNKTLKYPKKAYENGVGGKVICTFVIDTKGKVTNIQVIRSVDPDLDQEAVRVIENMPDWTPGKQRGKIVAVKYTLPIIFKLY